MEKIIANDWHRDAGQAYARAVILRHEIHPEGLDVDRVRFVESGSLSLGTSVGHIVSVLDGRGTLRVAANMARAPLALQPGVHVYLPPGAEAVVDGEAGLELLRVSSPSAAQARGARLLVRDERFLVACAAPSQSLRWVLTPQYLSRRVFLHHDPVLLSRSGDPVSWFRTTMFDVAGLPSNQDGEPVFKMSYNSRTEFNVCYQVEGRARVRMARHPYGTQDQTWMPWLTLSSDSTYHLNETAGGDDEERQRDPVSGTVQAFRNKHEVSIVDGFVTLFCLFDPAPAGIERHRPGAYSDYEPLSGILETPTYRNYMRAMADHDEMVDSLSLAAAAGDLATWQGTPLWDRYLEGHAAQMAVEAALAATLRGEGPEREQVLARWMQDPR
jgi:hypothetical protein